MSLTELVVSAAQPRAAAPVDTVSCILFIDGVRVADTGAQAVAGQPVALTGLKVAWGRDSTESQPDPSTCSFEVTQRPALGTDVADLLAPGATVSVQAAGLYAIASGQNLVDDPWMNWPADLVPSATPHDHVYPVGGATAQLRQIPANLAAGHYSGGGCAVDITVADGTQRMVYLPRPIDSAMWSEVPTVEEAGPLRRVLGVRAPMGTRMQARAYALDPATQTLTAGTAVGPVIVADGSNWATVEVTADMAAAGYPCMGMEVLTSVASLSWAATPGTWTSHPEPWAAMGYTPVLPLRVWTDVFEIWTTRDEVATRTVPVFAGRITDVEMMPGADGGVVAQCNATDALSELEHHYIGDVPWPVDAAPVRSARITTAAGIPPVAVPAARATSQLTARDVDSQPTLGLIRELADSLGCVAWLRTGWYLAEEVWMEDPSARDALLILALNPDSGLVEIVADVNQADALHLSACDVLEEPTRMRIDTDTLITVVDLTWWEQTAPDPTERHVIREDSPAREAYGYRRLGVSTQLADQPTAIDLADRILTRNRHSEWVVPKLVWDTLVGGGDAEDLLSLLDSTRRIAAPVTVTELPAWSPIGASLATWLEGGTYEYDDAWTLELAVAPASAAGASLTWEQMDDSWQWQQMDPAIDWRDLVSVGGS
jgi:hypothetical protein